MSSTRRLVLRLYRQMLREAEKMSDYNIRSYTARKIRDTFRANRTIGDHKQIDFEIQEAIQSLEIIRKVAILEHLYPVDKMVVEGIKTSHTPGN